MVGDYQPTLQELRDAVAMMKPLYHNEFLEKVRLAKNGDIINLFPGKTQYTDWATCAHGAIVYDQKAGQIFLNNEVIFQSPSIKLRDCFDHSNGVAILVGDKVLLNGKRLLYQGKFDKLLWYDGRKMIVQRGNVVYQNNAEKICKLDEKDLAYPHPSGGVIVRRHENGKFYWCDVGKSRLFIDNDYQQWWPHPQGVVVRRDKKLFINNQKEEIKVAPMSPQAFDYTFEDFRECCKWDFHPKGILYYYDKSLWINDERLGLTEEKFWITGRIRNLSWNQKSKMADGFYFCDNGDSAFVENCSSDLDSLNFLVWRSEEATSKE